MTRNIGKVDISKLEIIPEQEVPPPRSEANWEEVFGSVPKGKALVIEKAVRHPNTVRHALVRLQKMGHFSHLKVLIRTDKAFIIHSSEVSQPSEDSTP